ncbi:hypothetical protein H0W26_02430 [Candidatus Dependentiae bacterium]|nr:hypothetical protein [Candidatus Dependentiae bacterium]
MKKHIFFSFLYFAASSLQLHADFREGELVTAIKTMNKNQLETVLNSTSLNEEGKNRLLIVAKNNSRLCENNIRLTQSGWDCATFITGLLGASGSLSVLSYSAPCLAAGWIFKAAESVAGDKIEVNKEMSKLASIGLSGGLLGTALSSTALVGSLYLVRKGWRCTAAQNLLNTAKEIEALIQNAPVVK